MAPASRVPLPYHDPIHASIFWVAFAIWVGLDMMRSRRMRSGPQSRRDDRGSVAVVIIGLALAMYLAFNFALRDPARTIAWHRELVFACGVFMLLAGVALRTWAVRYLGRSFTYDVATREGQVIIDTGPYRLIRHPSYAGTVLSAAGAAFALGNWASVLAAVGITLVAYAYRISVEERVLSSDLGAPYLAYMAHTKRLIPYVF